MPEPLIAIAMLAVCGVMALGLALTKAASDLAMRRRARDAELAMIDAMQADLRARLQALGDLPPLPPWADYRRDLPVHLYRSEPSA